ncbi:MAG: hypothetical protein JNM47_07865 [Hyphomonadaceae bacterium]|nr:hypothetical protein [Hyphomonadaceae bacterium]
MNAFHLPPETAASIKALQTDLRLWVLTLVCWLAERVPQRWLRLLLQQCIRDVRQDVKLLIFAKTLMRVRRRESASLHPFAQPAAISAPPGFELRRRTTKTLKLVTRGIRLRTLRDIRHVIERIDSVVTRVLRRLPMTVLTHKLVAVRIPGCVFASCTPAPAAEAADTS